MKGCLACDLSAGRQPLTGGEIHSEGGWVVEHCVGPLGVGTLIVKPLRHVEHVFDLTESEAGALGGVLRQATNVVAELVDADQVYVCLWSHTGRRPGHIHFVVQPVGGKLMDEHDAHGPALQVAMFEADSLPDPDQVEAFCHDARRIWLERNG